MPIGDKITRMANTHKDFPDRLPKKPSINGFLSALKFGPDGLVTVVAQDAKSGAVLMLAHANRNALLRSLKTGYMHYFSRSRTKLWKKGEDSGHVQKLVSLTVDCDGDAILAQVRQRKASCHMGFQSCFSFRLALGGRLKVIGKKVFDLLKVYRKK